MKRLYRSRTDRMLFGVAGGIAKYFEVDVVLVRLVWVLAILSGPGIPAYIIAAIIIPEEPKYGYPPGGYDSGHKAAPRAAEPATPAAPGAETQAPSGEGRGEGTPAPDQGQHIDRPYDERGDGDERTGGHSSKLFGFVLIFLGAYFLLRAVLPGWWWAQFWWIRPDRLWPLILVAIGVAIILRRQSR